MGVFEIRILDTNTCISYINSHDAKRLSQVFREPENRLLVLIGPVVPRRSCTPAMLSQVPVLLRAASV